MELSGLLTAMFPRAAERYYRARLLRDASRKYKAAEASQFRPVVSHLDSGDGSMQQAGTRLRQIARHLDENHDLVIGVFDDLVNNTIGQGVSCAPLVRQTDGALARTLNEDLCGLFDEWADMPETTGMLGWEAMQRLVARSLFRDGEVFVHHVTDGAFNYPSAVRYVIELLEADFVPFNWFHEPDNILHGIESNAWGQPIRFYVWREHPGDPLHYRGGIDFQDLKAVPARDMSHLKFTRRLRQRRGVPVIHGVIDRLRDVQDYEESERIAAKVAADLTAFIRRTSEYPFSADINDYNNRQLAMQAGSIFELMPGEDVASIKSERPNMALQDFRNAMLRAVAAGTGTRFSSIARDYNGTYSAQRQELVEGAVAYRTHFTYLLRKFYRPTWARFIDLAVASGRIALTPDIDITSIRRADFRAPALPWIDPQKEAQAWKLLLEAKLESHAELIRQRGRDPMKVAEELEAEADSAVWGNMLSAAASEPSPVTDPESEPDAEDGDDAAAA